MNAATVGLTSLASCLVVVMATLLGGVAGNTRRLAVDSELIASILLIEC